MTYSTQPGTLPHRVVEFLKSKPQGAQFSTGELCDELAADRASFSALMVSAKKHGILRGVKKPGVLALFWSLGDGTPEALPEDYEPDEPLRTAPIAPPPVDSGFAVSAAPAAHGLHGRAGPGGRACDRA
jgi:hypothetical protein